jgi:hypothetical protein
VGAVRLDLFDRSQLGVIDELAVDPGVQRFTRFPVPASSKVPVRCGYHRDAILRSLYLKEGVRWDTEIWSRLPADP